MFGMFPRGIKHSSCIGWIITYIHRMIPNGSPSKIAYHLSDTPISFGKPSGQPLPKKKIKRIISCSWIRSHPIQVEVAREWICPGPNVKSQSCEWCQKCGGVLAVFCGRIHLGCWRRCSSIIKPRNLRDNWIISHNCFERQVTLNSCFYGTLVQPKVSQRKSQFLGWIDASSKTHKGVANAAMEYPRCPYGPSSFDTPQWGVSLHSAKKKKPAKYMGVFFKKMHDLHWNHCHF